VVLKKRLEVVERKELGRAKECKESCRERWAEGVALAVAWRGLFELCAAVHRSSGRFYWLATGVQREIKYSALYAESA